jgi:hypothetical protein
MHGRLKGDRVGRRDSITNWTITLVAAVLTFVLAVAADRRGIPKKWVTAIMGSLGSFSFVIYAYRRALRLWSFWESLLICLTVHCLVIWAFFRYVLIDFQTFSIWLWLPVISIETFVLLIVVKRIQRRLTGDRETIKVSL